MGRFEIWKDSRASGNAREPTPRSDCTRQAGVEVSATSGTRFLRKSEVGTTQRGEMARRGGMASQRADIGRYEARRGVPRPPPQPTGTMGPPGPCPVPLAPWGDAQAPEPRPIQQAARSAVWPVWQRLGGLHPAHAPRAHVGGPHGPLGHYMPLREARGGLGGSAGGAACCLGSGGFSLVAAVLATTPWQSQPDPPKNAIPTVVLICISINDVGGKPRRHKRP